jgi:hypothetical protein
MSPELRARIERDYAEDLALFHIHKLLTRHLYVLLRLRYFQVESSPDFTADVFETIVPGGNERRLQPQMIKWLTNICKEEFK